MIRLNAALNPSIQAPSRAPGAIPGQGGAFSLALAGQQSPEPSDRAAAVSAPANDADRQDLAAGGSDLPEGADTPLAALPDATPAEAAPPVDVQRPDWRFAPKPNGGASGQDSDDAAPDADGDHPSSKDDAADVNRAAPALQPLPLPVIAQPVPPPAAEVPVAPAPDQADAPAAVAPQDGRAVPTRTPGQSTVEAEADPEASPTGSTASAAKTAGQVAPSLAAIAPFAATAKAPPTVKPATPEIQGKAEVSTKEVAKAPQSPTPAAQQAPTQQHTAPHAAVAASLAAEALPVRTSAADRRHIADTLDGMVAGSLGTNGAVAAASVQPAADSQQPTLDLNRQDWMASMIDQIETLRDMDGARTARIRLNPDAMGTVDISVRQDGDAVHVHFASETAATRTLLGDAAPALAQLAEQRGIRLSQASVDAGAGQAGNQQRQDGQQAQRTTASAPASAQADEAGPNDERIA